VYWANEDTGEVMAASKFSGGASALVRGESLPTAVAVDTTYVYWTSLGGSVRYCLKQNCTAADLVVGRYRSTDIALDSTRLYWSSVSTTAGMSTVSNAAKTGGTSSALPFGFAVPLRLALDAQFLYISDAGAFGGSGTGAIYSWPLGGGSVAELTKANRPEGIAVNGSTIYYASVTDGTIYALDLPTRIVQPLARGLAQPYAVGVDAWYVYFTTRVVTDTVNLSGCTSQGTLQRIAKTGGTPVPLAEGLTCPSTIAVDDSGVYWVNNGTSTPAMVVADGSVMRVPKL
jgi:hypothetical protein